MKENERLEKAQKRVAAKKEFFIHLLTFCCVMPALFVVNFMVTPEFWWIVFPLIGWGMGLIGHYVSAFGIPGVIGRDWERKELEKEMDRLDEEEGILYEEEEDTLPEDQLELKEPIQLRKKWDEEDLV